MTDPKAGPSPSAPPAFTNESPSIPAQWSWHHKKLLEVRAWLTRKRDEREAAIRVALERGGADSGDSAIEERETMELLAKLSFSAEELTDVDAALERIYQGTYGICEVTGMTIAPERLRALPWTRLSVEAAAQREKLLLGGSARST